MAWKPDGASRLHFQTLFTLGSIATLTDGQLLERFATLGGDAAETSFAAIVERHGPMVFHACRGILGDEHQAQDAFQATFLVLIRKGKTLWVRDTLGPWLHRVACRAATRAKVEARRRQAHEGRAAEQAGHRRNIDCPGELAAVLHEEVDRLSDRYRVPILLCDLQGRTYEQAAQHLGCPVGTIRSRLARGRERLRLRLTRRGLAPSVGVLGGVMAPAAIPTAWGGSVDGCVRTILARSTLTPGEVPASVIAITEGVLNMMSMGRRTLVTAGVLTGFGLMAGARVLSQQAQDDTPRIPVRSQPEDDRRWVARLPGGGAIELLGVSTYPSGPDTWRRPDGSPMAEAPCDSPPKTLGIDGDFVLRVIAARLTGIPADVDRDWGIKEAGGSAGSKARKDGRELPGVETMIFGVRDDLTRCSVEMHAAAGPWRTVGAFDGRSPGGVSSKSGASYIFGEAVAGRRGTILTISHDIGDASVRVVSVDRAGKERPHVGRTGTGVKDFHQLAVEFDTGPGENKEYRLQTRPYERAEIPGVALRPGVPR